MTQLTQFPNLQSIFISIVNSKLLINDLRIDRIGKPIKAEDGNQLLDDKEYEDYVNEKNEYISHMYLWLTRYRHNRTFKSDVELNCLKAKLNYSIFDSIVSVSDIRKGFFDPKGSTPNMSKMHSLFYKYLMQILDKSPNFFEKTLFDIPNTPQSKLDLLDFIIDDTITCLSNIINTLPPHNQFSTFSNSFIANIYSDLWEWSKYNVPQN